MNKCDLKSRQQGMTLIEIMIASVLGLFLLAGVIKIFLGSKQSNRMLENLSRMQENGRFAMDFITQDVRGTGFFGCFGKNFDTAMVENGLDDSTNVAWDISSYITGYDDIDNTFSVFSDVLENTDVMVLRGLSGSGVSLVSPYSSSAQMFSSPSFNDDCPASKANTCHEGEILMVTDCSQGTVFQATQTTLVGGESRINIVHSGNNSYTPGNSSSVFNRNYRAGAQIAKLNTFGYFIRLNTANQPSLYRSSLSVASNTTNSLRANELVEGIENLQILYGEDTNGDNTPDYYLAAGSVGLNMAQVVSIRVSLLVVSLNDNLTSQPVAYTYNGATTTPTDRKLRRVFSSTIAVRNKLP